MCVTVDPMPISNDESFSKNGRPPDLPKFRREIRETRDRPNFEKKFAKLWPGPTHARTCDMAAPGLRVGYGTVGAPTVEPETERESKSTETVSVPSPARPLRVAK